MAVFISFSTKLVHLEVVSGLTTVSFIATMHHFIRRRVAPSVLWSDHSTNFVGAAKGIIQMLRHNESNREV